MYKTVEFRLEDLDSPQKILPGNLFEYIGPLSPYVGQLNEELGICYINSRDLMASLQSFLNSYDSILLLKSSCHNRTRLLDTINISNLKESTFNFGRWSNNIYNETNEQFIRCPAFVIKGLSLALTDPVPSVREAAASSLGKELFLLF